MKKLTSKQELFCKEYLVDLNATQAAIRAGYSKRTAGSVGHENLKKPEIESRISELKGQRAEKLDITAERVLEELAKIGFSNAAELRDSWDSLKDWDQLTDEQKSVISEVEVTTTVGESYTSTKRKVKLYDKLAALEKISRHIGFFEKDNDQKKPEAPVVNLNGLSKKELLALQAAKAALKKG